MIAPERGSLLVTGASGFVGLNLVRDALARGDEDVGLSTTPISDAFAAQLGLRQARFTEVIGDARDGDLLHRVMRANRVDRVVHMAAITASAERERVAADEIVSVNLAGLAAVLTAAGRVGVRRFVSVGSIAVFGGDPPDGSLIDEGVAHSPRTLYAITKSAGESITARLGSLLGIDWVVARLGRVFGPFEHDTGVRDTLSQIHQANELAIAGRSAWFERPCLKNWSYAPDVAAQLARLADAPTHVHRVYNLGTPHAFTLADWCALLHRRYPGFRYAVGGTPSPDASVIDLGGSRDSGLLSWQRFADEFDPAPSADIQVAFDNTLDFLDPATARVAAHS